jgi:hypothetical protein
LPPHQRHRLYLRHGDKRITNVIHFHNQIFNLSTTPPKTIMPLKVKRQSMIQKIALLRNKVEVPKAIKSLVGKKKRPSCTWTSSLSHVESSSVSSLGEAVEAQAVEAQRFFETVNQNEFVDSVLIDTCNDIDFIVHFYSEDITFSDHIEDQLLKLVQDASRSEYGLFRIDAQKAPYFTSKLKIDPDQTTVLRFKNGQVIGRISEFSSDSCYSDLQRWLKVTDKNDDFAGLELSY